ncbi:MAG: hypothetical protein K2G09_07895 [Paramuribaculum sp.]|nr:hypothetical protein [Paramuribaculum sp.]
MENKVSLFCLTLLALCSSCFTGVESTPKISAESVEKTLPGNIAEQKYLGDISGESPGAWKPGKGFNVTDSRIVIIFNPGAPELYPGDVIYFKGMREGVSLTGEPMVEIQFVDSKSREMTYRVDSSEGALKSRQSIEVPFTVENSVVDSVKARMKGHTFYILTPVWYDMREQSFTGRKYVPVKILDVLPGNSVYPIKLVIADEYGDNFVLFMSVGVSLKAPRGFHKLFSLTDPRLRYPLIRDEVWQNIINNRIAIDMTLDECRLALGAPAKVVRRADQSTLYEIWTYENGVYLLFRDGILSEYRR